MIDIPGQGPLGPLSQPQPEPFPHPAPGPFIPQTDPPGTDLPPVVEPVQTPAM